MFYLFVRRSVIKLRKKKTATMSLCHVGIARDVPRFRKQAEVRSVRYLYMFETPKHWIVGNFKTILGKLLQDNS